MFLLSDFFRFIWAVVSRVSAYVTGGVLAAIAFVYEHLSGQMISANIVLWGLGGFFVTGAFMAWREQYRSGRAIEIRNQLDKLVQRGQSLQHGWLSGKNPKWRSKRWGKTTRAFVNRHFDISEIDKFNDDISDLGDQLPSVVSQILDSLKNLRSNIHD